MRRTFALMVCMGVLVGCVGKKQHPVRVEISPEFTSQEVEKIAVFPFASSLHHSDDPDELAPTMMGQLFLSELDLRDDYNFIAPRSVMYALDGKDMRDDGLKFMETWAKKGEVDMEFLAAARESFQVDAILIGVIDVWQKDEVDYRENAAASTTVGATITIIDIKDGKVLFEAADEDFLESARSDTSDRRVVTSGLGGVQSDAAGAVYKAPEHKEVAIKVARALAISIPAR